MRKLIAIKLVAKLFSKAYLYIFLLQCSWNCAQRCINPNAPEYADGYAALAAAEAAGGNVVPFLL